MEASYVGMFEYNWLIKISKHSVTIQIYFKLFYVFFISSWTVVNIEECLLSNVTALDS